MTQAQQLERIAVASPPKGSTAIYLLDRGMGIWLWLCPESLTRRADDGWTVKERREPPHDLKCQDCGAPEHEEEARL